MPGRARARLRDFRTRLDPPAGLLVAAAASATYGGGHPTAPLRGLLTVIGCYYLVVGVRRTQPESWRAIGIIAPAGVAVAATSAFSQVTNETPTGFCRTGLLTDVACDAGGDGILIRATGTFANPNLLAAPSWSCCCRSRCSPPCAWTSARPVRPSSCSWSSGTAPC
ncbi:hypothetical protein AB5J49_20790 [Streptomyces sp. R28]|uniref:Uncharacterized protein n=1 Tax=Streptomyces sp. R28 TaxID=3238628 RepID=A0AB39PXP7_9ACTN